MKLKKRGIFYSKKAGATTESYFVVIRLVLVFAVMVVMWTYVSSVVNDTFFYKVYFSRDLAFTTNTVYSAPGSVYHEYLRKNLNKFEVDFQEQKVKLKDEGADKEESSFDYFYATNMNYMFKTNEIKASNSLVIQKSPSLLEVNKELNTKLKLIKCPEISTADAEWKRKFFLIDPEYSTNEEENIITGSVGLSLYNKFDNKDSTRDNTVGNIKEQIKKEPKKIKDLIEKSDVALRISIGDYQEYNNDIKIYVSSVGDEKLVKKRKKLGCLILNELLSDKELDKIFTGGKVMAINPEHIIREYGEILNNDKIGVVLEIGNIQSNKINEMKAVGVITQIAKLIYSGVEKYYG